MSSENWETETNWIWHPDWIDAPRKDRVGGIVLFHRTFNLYDVPEKCEAKVTADTRYRLWVNGQSMCIGPPKGDEKAWFYNQFDIAPYLKKGENIIAVRVLRYYYTHIDSVPFARLSYPGFFFYAACGSKEIKSDASWQCCIDTSIYLKPQSLYDISLQIYEKVDGTKAPQLDWKLTTDLDSRMWIPAKEYIFVTTCGGWTPWILEPSPIPPLHEIQRKFSGVVQDLSDHNRNPFLPSIADWQKLLDTNKKIRIPADSKCVVDIEYAEHITGFVRLAIVAGSGKDTDVILLPAECYEYDPPNNSGARSKGDRRDFKKGNLLGATDDYKVCGMQTKSGLEVYEPFWFRTFRFIRVSIETRHEPIELQELTFKETGYPLQVLASYEDEKTDPRFWTVSLRTLKNCMHDSYEDCPFYEQLQYAMDTRSEILFSYYVSGDDLLARKAIKDFRNAMQPDGVTFSRSPAHRQQTIPGFSLYWIFMIHDHLQYFSDVAFAKQFMSSIDAVLSFFDRHVDPKVGLIGVFHPRYWAYVDWVDIWPSGVPPAYSQGHATYFSLLYVYALKKGAEISRQIGRPEFAPGYISRATKLTNAINQQCFNGQYYTNGLASLADKTGLSQHTQIWAVLSEVADPQRSAMLMKDIFRKDKEVEFSAPSYPMIFYLFRALSLTPFYNEYFDRIWAPWKVMLANNLTTWEEDSIAHRSDCHAWSCIPLYEFPAEVLGLKPALPGWKRIEFQPRLLLRDEVKGKIPIPGRGMASVEWKLTGKEYLIRLDLDTSADVVVVFPDGTNRKETNVKSLKLQWTQRSIQIQA